MLWHFGRLVAAWVLLTALSGAAPAAARDDPFALLFGSEDAIDAGASDRPGRDDIRLVGLRLDGLKLADALPAYERGTGLCLVAADLFEALEAPVESDAAGARGWFLAPDRTVEIVLDAGTVHLGGQPLALPEDALSDSESGLCLSLGALSLILPIDFSYDAGALIVRASPRETLPLQARLEREALRARLAGPAAGDAVARPVIETPYRWLSWPVADISVGIEADAATGLSGQAGVDLTGDVLLATARVRTTMDASGETGLRVTLERVEDAPGGLRPGQVRVGDVSAPAQPLITRSLAGRGIVLTNRPSYAAEVFDTFDIRGPLPAGWEAELHANGQLLDFVTDPDNQGDYVFPDVALQPGYNHFTVSLFGPFGEAATREVSLFVGADMHPENEVQYSLALLEAGRAVDDTALGAGGPVAAASASIGLSPALSLRVDGRSALDGADGAAAVSLFASRGRSYGVLRLASSGEAPAIEAGLTHRLAGGSVVSSWYTEFGALVSDMTGEGDGRLVRAGEATLDTSLPVGHWGLPLRSEVAFEQRADGGLHWNAAARTGSTWRGLRWSHTARLSGTRPASGGNAGELGGELAMSRSAGSMRVRGDLSYDALPEPRLRAAGLAAQRRIGRLGTGEVGLARDMVSGETTLSAGLSRQFGRVALSAAAQADDTGGYSLGLRLSASLFHDRAAGGYRLAPPGLSRAGAIRLNLFDDLDGDGVMGHADRMIAGGRVILGGALRPEETDAAGTLLLGSVEPHRPIDLELQAASLDDPFLRPVEQAVRARVRPGQVLDVAMPVTLGGETDLTVSLARAGRHIPLAGVRVEAVDPAGRVVAEGRSDYDGYVYLSELPMGTLSLRIDEAALRRAGGTSEPVSVTLSRDAPALFGKALTIHIPDENREDADTGA